MTEIVDLEQDIAALKSEVQALTKKRDELKSKPKLKPRSSSTSDPIVNEITDLITQFPQLNEILLSKPSVTESSRSTSNEEESDKKRKLDNEKIQAFQDAKKSKLNNENDDLPEHEWVLKNQRPVEHKMFDTSVADVLNTEMLSSPSKRRLILKNGQDEMEENKHLQKEYRLLENVFRIVGISFFDAVDPNDLESDMIGIRLDPFNQPSKVYYIILKKEAKNNREGLWTIIKHTIPKYINVTNTFGESKRETWRTMIKIENHDDIYLLAKEVYVKLLLLSPS
ncbi:hypothetical protein NCAS_0F02850 [Naumovozyma castellii]|uniref:Uncharacterized protein n=1 Tax=Naumovozyma castellii TaxID=27288 RepID=G0VGZ8_NAUCA|nr:hypothetical protein NCAS_0F02850 [Naumovozyma castellii CBS 4309]CCC70769.1 hypothetical protein NCAS_0F02850 [Naumovozyma castellii CBS 4309]